MTDAPDRTTEMTPDGEQVLVPGVKPITLADRLALRAAAPMAPRRSPNAPQKPCEIGLFDVAARSQLDLLDFAQSAESGAPTPEQPRED